MLNDPSVQKGITTTAYSASGITAAGGFLSVNEAALAIGILSAIGTFIINWVYKAKQNKREIELHELEKQLKQAELEQFEQS
ncbi:hypothetical protein D5018_03910 [Parashewanella curva]|uniref:Holin n=2 Tax=Parashewanella curva TaxID=2338552 RepID=A0A3L8Q0H1_9GAMM|nr:hypothetical protein D5018_03910 [Parashewanella curva]